MPKKKSSRRAVSLPKLVAPIDQAAIEGLRTLIEGNDRFAKGLRSVKSFTNLKNLQELSKTGQKPFCTILACSDSRVPTEVIFDQKMGDLFVIRVAGNVATPLNLASFEYSVRFLGIQLGLVLGHSGCGAVNAAVQVKSSGDSSGLTPALHHLVDLIAPAVPLPVEDIADATAQAVTQHSRLTAKQILSESHFLAQQAQAGKLLLVSAVYDMQGRVNFHLPLKLRPLLKIQNEGTPIVIPELRCEDK